MTPEKIDLIKKTINEALDDPAKLSEFMQLMERGMNTWVPAPDWLLELSDKLNADRYPDPN